MKVIAITERGEDFATPWLSSARLAIAVIQLPEGKSEEEVFCSWVRAGCKGGHSGYDATKSDEKILDENTEYAYVTLTVQDLV